MPRQQSLKLITKKLCILFLLQFDPVLLIFACFLMSDQIHQTVTCIVENLQNYKLLFFTITYI